MSEQIDHVAGEPAEVLDLVEKAGGALPAVSRRGFLGGVAGMAAGTLAGGVGALVAGTVAVPEAEAIELAPGDPHQRQADAHQLRVQASVAELNRPAIFHPTNGDEELYPHFIGNFSKTLPHNALGEVDPGAYRQLLDALESGDLAAFDAVPQGLGGGLLNPIGGLAFSLDGADSPAIGVNPPPAFASAELAAQAAELYWMALLRDVPFAEYGTHPLVAQAAADLSTFSGYTGPKQGGQVTPQTLFRLGYPGELDGPMVSQFLLRPFNYDGIPVEARMITAAPGVDYVTEYQEWVDVQQGGGPPGGNENDPVLRYPRNVRDLGRVAGSDRIYSQYFRAANIASGFGGAANDAANPYLSRPRQGGFATFGLAHLLDLVGHAHKAERHTWYQKWNVHRFLRPEAFGGRVHNHVTGATSYPIHSDLLNSPVLPLIFEHNRQQNLARLGLDEGSYLLPLMFRRGGPAHPSFPAGHAVSAGACVAILKAWFREDFIVPNPVKASADGLSLEPYVVGVDGPPLTLCGELNKLAHNLSIGRDMSGVHWRADDVEGNAQGEEVAIRLLREEKRAMPEFPTYFNGFSLTKFNGTTVTT
jgi:hypothetical protein